ncbi:uncharacterized protein LOC130776155 isoform X2 [Actinidia eriantha]|uniref:uncharacterized protein LOC130776155 isoform X2 n=1 Tax=Actinidia eriantha TaxID=165200 RepID=UPI002582E958|nr:uncharacterized protein LOC130776155 isoform X2 [Actinidia eriantha]
MSLSLSSVTVIRLSHLSLSLSLSIAFSFVFFLIRPSALVLRSSSIASFDAISCAGKDCRSKMKGKWILIRRGRAFFYDLKLLKSPDCYGIGSAIVASVLLPPFARTIKYDGRFNPNRVFEDRHTDGICCDNCLVYHFLYFGEIF